MKKQRFSARYLFLIGVTAVIIVAVGARQPGRVAAEGGPDVSVQPAVPNDRRPSQTEPDAPHPPFRDDACILCHNDSEESITFPSGESMPVQVDTAVLAASLHSDLSCQECHNPNDFRIPHTAVTAETVRSYEIERSATCERCHTPPHLTNHPGAESENPVICTDCHTSHAVQSAESWHSGANVENCTACHEAQAIEVSPEFTSSVVQSGLFTAQKIDNDYCLACHSQPDLMLTFPNGDELSLTVDEAALHDSVHGADNSWQELQCTDCHQNYTFPHEPVTAVSQRQYSLNQNNLCQRCHEVEFAKALTSVHSAALQEGNLDAALCTDCHGAHDTPVPDEPRSLISETCRQCHSTIYDEYAESVHGEALITEANEDVPSCVNCHGVHDIQDPTTNLFRRNSPHLCADCHANDELMAEYEISTAVFETYVADFHGTTNLLFESAGREDAEFNEAVCYDCHGVHNIKSTDDPHANINENLLETCQQCHPDASENFPASWTSHYEPSLDNYALVYLVELFYKIVIPITLGFFGFLVVIDVYGRVRRRGK